MVGAYSVVLVKGLKTQFGGTEDVWCSSPGARTCPGRPAGPGLGGISEWTVGPDSGPQEYPPAAQKAGLRADTGGQTHCGASCKHGRSPSRQRSILQRRKPTDCSVKWTENNGFCDTIRNGVAVSRFLATRWRVRYPSNREYTYICLQSLLNDDD